MFLLTQLLGGGRVDMLSGKREVGNGISSSGSKGSSGARKGQSSLESQSVEKEPVLRNQNKKTKHVTFICLR